MPRVSVIIPTYNHAHFLKTALESVQAQTLSDWEAIVIDNFSNDNTVSVVEALRDPRIRLVQFPNKGIIAASRNHGISLTSAPYVAFLDSDDSWYPEKLALSLEKLQHADLVCHAEMWVGPGQRKRQVQYGPSENASYDNLLFNGNCISTSAVVVDRNMLQQVHCFSETPRFNTAEDYDLWLKLAAHGARIQFINHILGEYRIHETNHSRSPLRNMRAIMAVFNSHVKKHPDSIKKNNPTKQRRGTIYYSGARSLHAAGHFRVAKRYYTLSIRLNPCRLQTWVAMLLNTLHIKL